MILKRRLISSLNRLVVGPPISAPAEFDGSPDHNFPLVNKWSIVPYCNIEPSCNSYKYLRDHQGNRPEIGAARLFKKGDRSKNKFFNEKGKGTQDGMSMVPQQVLDTAQVSLILQVPCPGDKDTPVYGSCFLDFCDYCEELGHSCKI